MPYELRELPPLAPLPWEDPNDPRYQKPPELQIDYPKIRTAIMGAMSGFLKAGGEKPRLVALVGEYGGKLSEVPDDDLQSLLNDINRLNPETPNT